MGFFFWGLLAGVVLWLMDCFPKNLYLSIYLKPNSQQNVLLLSPLQMCPRLNLGYNLVWQASCVSPSRAKLGCARRELSERR